LNVTKLVIDIDGPAAAGKSTTAKLVAQQLGYLHIDTGAMYRAVTKKVLKSGISSSDVEAIGGMMKSTHVELRRGNGAVRVFLDNEDVTENIRTAEVTQAVSAVSAIRQVREAMVREQRRMADGQGIVLEGRDIGTVVFPDADLKVFMVASIEARAQRRRKELEAQGINVDIDVLRKDIEERDRLDSTRFESPLKPAADAIELDTSNLMIEQQVEFIVKKAREILERRKDA
jgi:cytidylate kinase